MGISWCTWYCAGWQDKELELGALGILDIYTFGSKLLSTFKIHTFGK
jgi:hypothetical protein